MCFHYQMVFIDKQALISSGLNTILAKCCQENVIFISFFNYMNSPQFMVVAKAKTELVPAFSIFKHPVFPALQVITTGYGLNSYFYVGHWFY